MSERNSRVRELDRYRSGSGTTYVVHVMYREHGSWQGTVQWLNARCSLAFRSVLEMVSLLREGVDLTGTVDDETEPDP